MVQWLCSEGLIIMVALFAKMQSASWKKPADSELADLVYIDWLSNPVIKTSNHFSKDKWKWCCKVQPTDRVQKYLKTYITLAMMLQFNQISFQLSFIAIFLKCGAKNPNKKDFSNSTWLFFQFFVMVIFATKNMNILQQPIVGAFYLFCDIYIVQKHTILLCSTT